MTDSQINQPAAIDDIEEVKVAEPQTLEQLNESIRKLEANKNEILIEKRAESTAKQLLQGQLDSALQATAEANNKLEALMIEAGRDKLINLIAPVKGSEDFINHKVQSLITLENGKVSYKNAQGNAVTASELANEVRENKDLSPYLLAFPAGTHPTTQGGGLASGGLNLGSSSRSTNPKSTYTAQFGLK